MRRLHELRAMRNHLFICVLIASGVTYLGCSSDTTVKSTPLDAQAKEESIKQIQGGQPITGRGVTVAPKSIKGKVIGRNTQ
jgi:hypothetical protein